MAKNQIPTGDVLSRLVSLCKRRGIIFPSSEIYGGVGSTYDYGPSGVEMKKNISHLWWHDMTLLHENIVGLDSAIILHPRVWEASGHLAGFTDPMRTCKSCKKHIREDNIDTNNFAADGKVPCPYCGGELTPSRQFNLMFKTHIGPVEDSGDIAFFRPETAQGIYLDYKIVQESSRLKIPFGIAQIGKSFRNEITPGNFIFRTREFEQMEMQFFIRPGENEKWLEYWRQRRWNWLVNLGVNESKLRWHQHPEDKRAHYARDAWDVEYEFPFGWNELEGIHDRGCFDLTQHQTFSGKDLTYFDDETRERFIPHIVETAVGLNRTLLMILCDAYREDEQAGEQRIYLSLDPKIAPVKAAIFPLVKKDGIADIAHSIYEKLIGILPVFYDEQGSIGKRYRRQDEIGTPFCFTIDYQTKEDNTITVRWRDTLQQERINKDQIPAYLTEKLSAELSG